ncbi:hypothetical protein GF318_04370 [Candidatus Micrarchaeota archaeon]|nr:hypothetical protein [Candidatus Micrarchaeota archaeon]
MTRPLIASIVYNHDCICSDVPERYPDTDIRYLAELGVSGDKISHLFNLKGGEVEKFIGSLRAHHTASQVKVLRKNEDSADVITVTNEGASTHHALNESGCAFISTPVYDSGTETVRVFASSFESLKQFIDSLKNSYNVKLASKKYLQDNESICTEGLLKSGYLEVASAANKLTKRQSEALRLAGSMDYYDMPKKSSIRDIANRMGISEAAASELLRKAEKKLLPSIARMVELSN